MGKVALIKGDDRKQNILKALELIKKNIKNVGNKTILIKPNFVSDNNQLASTHVDAAEAVLEFFSDLGKKKFVIADASAHDTLKAFKNFNYYKLRNKFNVDLVDLNKDDYEEITLNFPKKPVTIRVAKTLLDKKNYIVSLALLKTHNVVVATLSLKNFLMGGILNTLFKKDKPKMHQGYEELSNYLFLLSKKLYSDLNIIDGFEGMEGNGPTQGISVDSRIAIASSDSVACDRVGVECMGIDAKKVGYLRLCGKDKIGEYDLKNIKILGNNIKECKKIFKMQDDYEKQIKWLS